MTDTEPDPTERIWLRVAVTTDDADLVSDLLVETLDLGGTQVHDDSSPATVLLYVDSDDADSPDALRNDIEEILSKLPARTSASVASVEPYTDRDWKTEWKAFFEPRVISPRIRVGPPWETFNPPGGRHPGDPRTAKVVLDPGMAFGTGMHKTTHLSAEFLDLRLQDTPDTTDILDVGCGSGILSIIAVKLDAASATGIDIEENAVDAARSNADANDVADACDFSRTPITKVDRQFPIVVANILSHILDEIRDDLLERVEPGGTLILSGVTTDEADDFYRNFLPTDWDYTTRNSGDWSAACAERPT